MTQKSTQTVLLKTQLHSLHVTTLLAVLKRVKLVNGAA
ncbi:hypothetical protein MGSAQ_002633 [marine sediment metagenome]|uniref:Uncharacterized protein n=1 Tax=marine sediment metagenome TaxID=412755 RepID=A0A1B6NRF3_9ZZZZ